MIEELTPEQIRSECEELEWDIERYQEKLDDAESRLLELQRSCKHPSLERTGCEWPYTDDCPDCKTKFYLSHGKEETRPRLTDD